MNGSAHKTIMEMLSRLERCHHCRYHSMQMERAWHKYHVVIGASSILLLGIFTWGSRIVSRIVSLDTAENAEETMAEGPLMNYSNMGIVLRVLESAERRAATLGSMLTASVKQMDGQVGGLSAHKRSLLSLEPNLVMKPLALDHRGIRELAFYEFVASAALNGLCGYAQLVSNKRHGRSGLLELLAKFWGTLTRDPSVVENMKRQDCAWKVLKKEVDSLRALDRFIPRCFGVVHMNPVSPSTGDPGKYGISHTSYLVLHDTTSNLSKPCVIDIKLGTQSYEPDAPPTKQAREISKYPEQQKYGFRIVGMRVYLPSHRDADANGFIFFGKNFGRSLSSLDEVRKALATYFGFGDVDESMVVSRRAIVSKILLELRSLQTWFRENESIAFYASSLLIAYEGDQTVVAKSDSETVKMIDFGRVRRQRGGDPGYLLGLDTLISILEDIF